MHKSPAIMVLMQTDLPLPVEPATKRCGILLKSAVIMLPLISLPRPMHSLPPECFTASQSTTSLKKTVSFFRFGTSMPIAALPGIGASIRTPGAASFKAISSARFTTELTLTPGAGSSSNRVTDGPRVTATTLARTLKSASVCSKMPHWWRMPSSRFRSLVTTGVFNRVSGGNL